MIKPVLIKILRNETNFYGLDRFYINCCSKVAKEGKSCPRLLVLQSCSKVAAHNLFMPNGYTNDKSSWSPLTSERIRTTFRMYCLVGGFIIMYNLTSSLFLLNSRAWIHNYRCHYHSYHNPSSTNTHNHTQTNYLPTEMLG